MILHDYILMLIEQLVKFLAQVFFKKKAGNLYQPRNLPQNIAGY
jgi:hypothetical protein